MLRQPPYDKYTNHWANEQAKKARDIHKVEYPGMNHIKGVMRGLFLGICAWGVLLAIIITIFAVAVL